MSWSKRCLSLLFAAALVVACGDDSDDDGRGGDGGAGATGGAGGTGGRGGTGGGGGTGGSADPDCFVHLFEDDDFDTGDDNFVLRVPGRYSNLRNLPGANRDWGGDEIDSLRVGSAATVTVWTRENFQGTSRTFPPGSEDSDVDDDINSLELSCP